MSYDPRPRRHRGHRKGVEPAGLRRWRLAHRSKRAYDPIPRRRRHKISHSGPRGGKYWRGPTRRRYDPSPSFARARSYAHRAGSKMETGINKYGALLGAGLAALYGVFTGYQKYSDAYGPNAWQNYVNTIKGGEIKDKNGAVIGTRPPEITHVWQGEHTAFQDMDPADYLQLKFLGQFRGAPDDSAWVAPFWVGLIATLVGPIAKLFTHKGQRILRPVHKIGTGALAMSTIGALALPGCDKQNPAQLAPPPASPQKPQTNQYLNNNNGAY